MPSRCDPCHRLQIGKTRFESHPHLLAFEWDTTGNAPSLQNTIVITCNNIKITYTLKGVIYYANNHFTYHVILNSGMMWYHDGMVTQQTLTLYNQPVSADHLATATVANYCQRC